MSPWVTLLVGLVAATAVLTAGDLVTAQARLRRRLDKELTILTRLDVPGARERLAALVDRHSWELVYRGEEEGNHRGLLINLFLSVFLVLSQGFGLIRHAATPMPGDEPLTWWGGFGLGAVLLAAAIRQWRRERRERAAFIQQHIGTPPAVVADPDS